MSKDLENIVKKQESIIEALDRRLKYCEAVAREYETMFKQLQMEMKAITDRQGNIQQVYDYMTRVGSEIAIKTPHNTRRLNPLRKALPMSDKKYIEGIRRAKFQVCQEVFYARENTNEVTKEWVRGIDVIDTHPRYILADIFGYIDESKIFLTEEAARDQLDRWNRDADVDRYL